MPHRLWRGKLPECFAKVHLDDGTRFRGTRRFDLRKRPQRKRMYELLLRRGQPEELIDWIDIRLRAVERLPSPTLMA